jgi:antitoxin (DNA-binding transcriptional repressor) of toxin-antitoxin stability system
MATISIQEAQIKLSEIIHGLAPGEELVITENDQPVARIVTSSASASLRQLGSLHGTVRYMAPDFDAPLDDFEESMK